MAATLPEANGSRPTSARTSATAEESIEESSLRKARVCRSMFSEKSAAITRLKSPDFANLRVNRPLPQDMSTSASPKRWSEVLHREVELRIGPREPCA